MSAFWFDVVVTLVKLTIVIGALMGGVSVMTWVERRLSAVIQDRWGPNRVGPFGLFQPIADGIKFIMKEDITPQDAHKPLFTLAPALALVPALFAFAVVPFGPRIELFGREIPLAIIDRNGGLLFAFAATSLGVYGVVCAGWASRSKYSLMGGLRSSAQMVSYELAMGFALVVVLMVSGSLNLSDIVAAQGRGTFASMGLGVLSWNWLPLAPILFVYFVSGVAETNRAPFDVVEGESEIVAGHMVEYSGMTFALFFLAEYMNMILISTLTVVMFFGGWGAPVDLGRLLGVEFPSWTVALSGWVWLFAKVFCVVSLFIWVRASVPRYRYDQIMRLGWKVFIPITLAWLIFVAVWMQTPWNIWK